MTPWMDTQFTKSFPGISIRGEFTWHDRPRRVTALFGPSGCGKTTILRCMAGLERPEDGFIRVFGEEWCDTARRLHAPPQQRRVGFLFQDYLLFPHLCVRDNIAFGAPANTSRHADVDRMLERFQLQGMGGRLPRELSGGQQQRVALARVLAAQPRLLCLDEPLSALDGPTRAELRIALRDWLHEAQLPALIVSHDAIEVQTLADDVIVLSDGQARQSGSVAEVWHRPRDAAVARIVGFENLLPVNVVGGDSQTLEVAHGPWQILGVSRQLPMAGQAAIACIRAEDIRCAALVANQPSHSSATPAMVLEIIPERGMWRLRLKLTSGPDMQAVVSRETTATLNLQPGNAIEISVAPDAAVIVPAT